MNKLLLVLAIIILCTQTVHAVNVSKYFDYGLIYSGSKFPIDVAKNADDEGVSIVDLKKGEATTSNILGLFEGGNAGIQAAAMNGGITKIHYVDRKIDKVYIPLGFIPIYTKQTRTIVYGE